MARPGMRIVPVPIAVVAALAARRASALQVAAIAGAVPSKLDALDTIVRPAARARAAARDSAAARASRAASVSPVSLSMSKVWTRARGAYIPRIGGIGGIGGIGAIIARGISPGRIMSPSPDQIIGPLPIRKRRFCSLYNSLAFAAVTCTVFAWPPLHTLSSTLSPGFTERIARWKRET